LTAQPDKSLAQAVAGGGKLSVRPENIGGFFTGMPTVRVKCQKRKKGRCLLCRKSFYDPVTTTGAQDTEQVNTPQVRLPIV
jgi:hypothetical protein